MLDSHPRVLIVDLNNFSMYPTLAVGYLTSILRRQGMQVRVLAPLNHGIPGVVREPPETTIRGWARQTNYLLTQMPGRTAASIRRGVAWSRSRFAQRHFAGLIRAFEAVRPSDFDVVLVSAYLMYHPVCAAIGKLCRELDIPLVVGGSYFANEEVARSWVDIPGLTALIGGEIEIELASLVRDVAERRSLVDYQGVWLPDGRGGARPPLVDLDHVPFPDFTDFPWHKYPSHMVPLITGRGCGWGACTFCSDVTSTAGRSFRSRSPDNVFDEIAFQSRAWHTNRFVFTDLKLNSNLEMWEQLARRLPRVVEDPRWIGSVHVGADQPNGLDLTTLRRMKAAGACRLTTGLESGSQRLLDAMAKGSDLSVTSQFLKDATSAGLSMRVTMMHGTPGETVADVHASARFLEDHVQCIDRVSLNRFQLMMGPTLLRRLDERPERYPGIIVTDRTPRLGQVEHRAIGGSSLAYLAATRRLLQAVHRINRKVLPSYARVFEGVM